MNSIEDFIEKSNKKHNYRYNYDNSVYINNQTKLIITCAIHGDFMQKPVSHYIQGCGCPLCAKEKISELKKSNLSLFIKRSNEKHKNLYGYSKSVYVNAISDIEIICSKHGSFYQKPYVHLRGHGCPKCANEKISMKNRKDKVFIEKSNEIHNNMYDYSLVDYLNNKTKVKIKCNRHGIFEQTPSSHLQGHGCPNCSASKGEKEIEKILNKNKIDFIRQYSFKDCRYKLPLYFDFYLLKYNLCIEFDGELHFGIDTHFNYDKDIVKIRDNIKNNYCRNNNIRLVRISYKENITNKMNGILSELSILNI
jgi:hypothetical protein